MNDQILKSLKAARARKGLSQRALSAKSGVPQSHISKIESGGVDLRVSSLIALARVLGLELELVPKKSIPAVKSIVRSSENLDQIEAQQRMHKEMSKLENVLINVSKISSLSSVRKKTDSIMKVVNLSKNYQVNIKNLEKIGRLTQALEKALNRNSGIFEAIRKLEKQMSVIRNIAVHSPSLPMSAKPAYSLDETVDE